MAGPTFGIDTRVNPQPLVPKISQVPQMMMPRWDEVTEEEHEPQSIFRKLVEYKARVRRKVILRRKTVFKGPEAKECLARPGKF